MNDNIVLKYLPVQGYFWLNITQRAFFHCSVQTQGILYCKQFQPGTLIKNY